MLNAVLFAGVLTVLYVLEFIPRWLALLSVLSWTVAARVAARKLAAEVEAQVGWPGWPTACAGLPCLQASTGQSTTGLD
jgi:hypothetical protein